MKKLILLFILIQAEASTAINKAEPLLQGRKIVDPNATALANYIDKDQVDAIGRFSVNGGAFGTVSHLGNGLVITAGHVVSDKNCPNAIIEWAARGKSHSLVSTCEEIVYREVGRYYDIAIFKVNSWPESKIELISNKESIRLPHAILLLGHMGGSDLLSSFGKAITIRKRTSVISKMPTGSGDSGAPIFSLDSKTVIGIYSGREGTEAVFTLTSKLPSNLQ